MVKLPTPWTDNPQLPDSLVFVSRRIATEIVQKAGLNPQLRKGGGFDLSTPIGGFGVSLPEIVEPDYQNIYELAARATLNVAGDTARVDNRGPRFANLKRRYLRTTMHLQMQDVDLGVWERHNNHPVAAFVGYEYFPGVGRVFLGMVGSAHNHLPAGSIAPGGYAGRTPSHAAGLYDIIQESRELLGGVRDPAVSSSELAREASYCPTEEARFHAAAGLFRGSAISGPSFLAEVLVQVHHYAENFDLNIDSPDGRVIPIFQKVLLGAPIWIGLPESKESIDSASGLRTYQLDALGMSHGSVERSRVGFARRVDAPDPDHNRIMASVGRPTTFDTNLCLELNTVPGDAANQSWKQFDSWLQICVDVQARRRQPRQLEDWPPSVVEVKNLAFWFLEQAMRIGPDPIPFAVPVRSRRFGRRDSYGHEGAYGWVLRGPSARRRFRSTFGYDGFAIVLTDGTLFRSDANGMYSPVERKNSHARAKPLELVNEDRIKVAAQMLHEVVAWRRPMYQRSSSDPVLIVTSAGRAELRRPLDD